jgi:hypothetical protein
VVVRDGDGVGELVPCGVTDDGEPHAAALGHAECGLERPFVGVLLERRDEGDVVVLAEAHLGDAGAKVELRHDLGERRLLGSCDEDGVGGEHGGTRRGREGLTAARDRHAAERHVDFVERQPVQARDRVERERRLCHQLRRRAGSCEAGDRSSTAHAVTELCR